MIYSKQYIEEVKSNLANIVGFDALCGKSVFITGVTGLIGSIVADMMFVANKVNNACIKLFLGGRNVYMIEKRFNKFNMGDYRYINYDLMKGFQSDLKFDYIIHCAGNAHPKAYVEQPVETLLGCVLGVRGLLEYLREKQHGRLLYVSSSEVYGDKLTQDLFDEKTYYSVDILNFRACYPSGKRSAETLCIGYKNEYGVDSVIVRPGHVYGPNITDVDSRAHAQFLKDAVYGKDIVMKSDGMQLRSYCHVFDCVTAMLTVLLTGKSGEAYNISNRDSVVTIRDFAQMYADLSGKKLIFANPSDYEVKGYNLMSNSALNADKLYGLGWQGKYNLKEGVEETLRDYKG